MDKRIIKSYKELKEDIELIKMRLKGLEEERELLVKNLEKGPSDISSIAYDGMPKGSQEYRDIIYWIKALERCERNIYLETETLKIKENTLESINSKINSYHGVEKKIIYLKEVEGKNLKEIAAEIGYNYDYIRRIHANANKKVTTKSQTI